MSALPTVEQLCRVRDLVGELDFKRRDPSLHERITLDEVEAERLWGAGYKRFDRAYRIGIPPRFWGASLATGEQTPAVRRVAEYVEREHAQGNALTLLGGPGVGKTYAGVGALLELPWAALRDEYDRSARRFFHGPALAHEWLDPDRRDAALEVIRRPSLIVLDDVGAEHCGPSGFVQAMLEEMIWHREAYGLPTIITSNLTVAQLRARLGDRALDRLTGPWGSIFAVSGPSLRRRRPGGSA